MAKYLASPNYAAPFDGWVVHSETGHYFGKFVGPQAQLDAQTLAHLLNKLNDPSQNRL